MKSKCRRDNDVSDFHWKRLFHSSSGQNNLIYNVSKQINERLTNLPAGTDQTILIDVRGQNVTNGTLKNIRSKILEKSDVNVEIIFKR